jgi:gluconolactonase
MIKNLKFLSAQLLLLSAVSSLTLNASAAELIAQGAEVQQVSSGFSFTEGPAADQTGNVYFTDIPNNRIHIWTTDEELKVFRDDTRGANGLFFDADWQLFAAEGGGGRIIRMDTEGNPTVVVEQYNGKPFNSPNDLWIDASGGIYFTDPRYGDESNIPQSGYHVYYVPAGSNEAQVVITDLVKPNGIIGTRDGNTLYVADHLGNQTFTYTISGPGQVSAKRLFAPQGSDGLALDEQGNLYLTGGSNITAYSPAGELLETIAIPLAPANMTFGGPNRDVLYITARTALFSLKMAVRGMY